ncbi:MAG: hypothetical protein E7564_01030 [Ruminococcaceae bacterium]|nr:hypothetical protein [Oscillospiraceae bacterium]
MYFNNVNNLTLKDLSFAHTATFAIEIGDATNVHCKNIEFNECFADGLHVNGGVENLIARNLSGILKMI